MSKETVYVVLRHSRKFMGAVDTRIMGIYLHSQDAHIKKNREKSRDPSSAKFSILEFPLKGAHILASSDTLNLLLGIQRELVDTQEMVEITKGILLKGLQDVS